MKYFAFFLAAAFSVGLPVVAGASVLYVNANGANPTPPYTNWPTAAITIQAAVDAATNGDTILVTNGVYATGALSYDGASRVAVTKAVTLQSVNGPAVTLISGYQVPGTTNGATAIRCVHMTNGAVLAGFTLTNGATVVSSPFSPICQGGGVWCQSTSAVLSNCVLVANSAYGIGGGAYSGSLFNCTLITNSSTGTVVGGIIGGGGCGYSYLNNCLLAGNSAQDSGGGTFLAALTNCVVAGNWAGNNGGGAYQSTLVNCLVFGNSATNSGGADRSTLFNSTVVSNSAISTAGGVGGEFLDNCIVYYNTAPVAPNCTGAKADYCCSIPLLQFGVGNITNDPAFVNLAVGDFHLRPVSRCINSAGNTYVKGTLDLDGSPRISGFTVDMGAYEFQAQVTNTFNVWLQQHGLPTDGSADNADSDGDGMKNWQEWLADTDPADASSVLRLASPSNGVAGVTVTWQSVNSRIYSLQHSVNLAGQPAFTTIQSNILGQAGTTSFIDTKVVGSGPVLYRVGVQ